ncbi:lysozyme inhibitor LprI family protein [Kaistia terrae]|uniref:Lysozyme inhibitor LprI family protein n=1 Tax=Kaistia terrae TaxID=537017 RepID=A0ABW0PYI0_9HYPH|nr:lysozyme inhibitor LprI family protein [Kaistia terrae]MCX5579152.1 lysozyme inhibitor LprI family protein [Kaistia terrae]
MRLILAGLLFLAGGALFSPALAQDNAVDPIDATLSQCLEKPAADSTTGMVACFNAARDAWEKEVVRAYSNLSATLDARSRGILRGTQKQWEAYKAAEQRFQQARWARDRGTMIAVTLASQNADLFKNRALTLRGYKAE